MGLGIMMYTQDYDETYPQAYWYTNDVDGSAGYNQWSGMIQPYVKNVGIFVCPSDPNKGIVPTNPGLDLQAPRISYVANGAVLPRKRRSADPANVASAASIDAPADVIVIGEMTNTLACINDTSNAGTSGGAYVNKSHRSTNAYMTSATGGTWKGEAIADYQLSAVYAVTPQLANAAFAACKATGYAGGALHIAYTQADRHTGGSCYTFADGHSKWMKLEQTLNPNAFLWGKQVYTAGNKPVLDQNGIQVR
jgi:prepilin-type processing-associated H-X9-DG protein